MFAPITTLMLLAVLGVAMADHVVALEGVLNSYLELRIEMLTRIL